jgi:hypothetical protein
MVHNQFRLVINSLKAYGTLLSDAAQLPSHHNATTSWQEDLQHNGNHATPP